jgi:GST-like protein
MIDFYTADTPNGQKVELMLEELGLEYKIHKFNLPEGKQKSPEFLKINPNGKIPAIVDSDTNLNLAESGAILFYLAEKTAKFLPTGSRYEVMQWLMFQMSGVGPMMGQAFVFLNFAPEKIPFAIDRYINESKRLLGVMNEQLSKNEYLAGSAYSIADIATFPWIRMAVQRMDFDLSPYPSVQKWLAKLEERPAVKKVFNLH